MKVTQEKLPASQIGLEIEITPEITQKTYEQVIKNLSRTVNIPGFRKGKVPRQVLLQRLGKTHIKAAALEELLQDGIEQAIKQESIAAIGQPRLRSSFDDLINSYEPGQPLTFTAAVDVEPEINLVQYTGLEAKAEEIKYDPARVDEVLEKERQELATLIPVEGRSAQIGDVAVVDFKGVIAKAEGDDENAEPEPIPGGDASDFQVELQEDRFIPGFVTGIVGMNPGDTKEVSAQFPDPYVNQELAGKPAIFTVTLKEIKEKELPELNDDFAQEVSDFDTLEALRASLAERYQKEAEDKTKNNQQEALLGELVKHIEVDLPETLIEKEVDAMLTQTAMRLSQQGLDVKKLFTQDIIPQLRERSRPEAVERLKRSLGLQEVAKRESITVTPEEIQARVTELVQQYPDEDIDAERLQTIVENELLSEKIIDWLLANSTVELVPEGSLASQEPEITAPETEAETIEVAAESTTGE
ncbi:trigger factor [Anabaena sp. FACHB-709]|uniref:Trigger factor n=3 Tax=Nostocaceae TaxID=1162 RepID=TIG_NOSS1|nr:MULTISPECIES: trigger factor [Nostocaceae]Q8YQX9.1 RecName: Full=Trigger factor; Short=TF; AltName: Full=PPIase [Nostoc sp. PCC 7120 = FACHB-418]BAY69308.1 trigger factor [Trichormus variabilis NIES-23]HBW30591.1 trigger factor [Nostoc sp. UBA8866]MBD2174670.1 trigger factor [Anabaena cylindrica FACHB-318]MBD2266431.1 trigger factor [Anabaena sp. FACHB-709]MBD2275843.1 trigger factor [Nostoc sp. PCC 7120 = FACHB-418]